MTKTISFNELRKIKDCLPDGSMHKIADRLNINVQTVRNYFGGTNYSFGKNCGLHIEPGPDGGIVVFGLHSPAMYVAGVFIVMVLDIYHIKRDDTMRCTIEQNCPYL